jgi:O-antigen/teichoic acid export membrane protein
VTDGVDAPITRGTQRLSGFTLILLATVIAGVVGYVITWLVPRQVGFASYAGYAVYWSLLFLLIGSLSGIQQEMTRASSSSTGTSPNPRGARAGRFMLIAALLVAVLVMATSPLWASATFGLLGFGFAVPLAFGAAFYVIVAVVGGALYGASAWRPLFFLIATEAVTRLLAIGIVLVFTKDTVVLAWAVVLPFPVTLAVLSPWLRRRLTGQGRLDVDYRRLIWNVARTIAAACSLGVMVSGLPFLLGVTSPQSDAQSLGLLIIAITLTRAPLIVVVMALQSFLVVFFRDRAAHLIRAIGMVVLLIAAAAVIFSVAIYFLGPFIFGILFPGQPTPSSSLLVVLVVSSALVGLLCTTGPAVLSLGRHGLYSVGWVSAAVVTIVCLLLPLPLTDRTVSALVAAPIVGLIVHGIGLATLRRLSSLRTRPAD